jgi:hypothetical protein
MRRGKMVSCGILVTLAVFMAAFVVMAQQKAPDVITIKEFPNPTKGAVEFSHQKHNVEYKIACNQCHHVYKDGKNNTWKEGDPVEKCSKCHTNLVVEGEKKLSPEEQKLNLKLAFHGDCQGCHQKLKKDNPNSKAPVTCTGCHPAEKKQ